MCYIYVYLSIIQSRLLTTAQTTIHYDINAGYMFYNVVYTIPVQ